MKCCSSSTSFPRSTRAIGATILLIAAIGLQARGESPSQDRFALTPGQVARALAVKGMPTSAQQVSLLARVVASDPDPALDILSVELLSKGQPAQRSRVKLACHVPAQCLPFYAMVSAPPSATISASLVSRSEYTMRAGAHATLMMDDARAHIQVKVISLENGMAGKRIRVSSLDHRQIYFGEIISAGLLKGSF